MRKRDNFRAVLVWMIVLAAGLIAAGCASEEMLEDGSAQPPPAIEKRPLRLAVVIPDDTRQYRDRFEPLPPAILIETGELVSQAVSQAVAGVYAQTEILSKLPEPKRYDRVLYLAIKDGRLDVPGTPLRPFGLATSRVLLQVEAFDSGTLKRVNSAELYGFGYARVLGDAPLFAESLNGVAKAAAQQLAEQVATLLNAGFAEPQ